MAADFVSYAVYSLIELYHGKELKNRMTIHKYG